MSKHLDLNDRNQIYIGVESGKSLGEIANELHKAETTIAREVKHHKKFTDKGAFGRVKNRCIHRKNCTIQQLCENKPDCTRKCSTCSHCNTLCADYVEEICPRTSRPPYVCNGCPDKPTCTLTKWMYDPIYAQDEYNYILTEWLN